MDQTMNAATGPPGTAEHRGGARAPGLRGAVLLGVMMGFLGAMAAHLNGSVALVVGDPILAALVSFVVGTVLLLLINCSIPGLRRGMRRVAGGYASGVLPWWFVFEGAVAAFGVSAQSQSVALVGVALFTITAVAGQTVSGMFVDRLGFGPGGTIQVTPLRVAASLIVLAAVVIAMSDKLEGSGDIRRAALPLALTFVAGLTMGFQQAMNGRTAMVAGSPMVSTLQNFAVGTVFLVAVVLVRAAGGAAYRGLPAEWWLYLSGPIAIGFVFLIGFLVRTLGVLMLGICAIAGQVAGSLLLDLLFPKPGAFVSAATLAGAALTMAAIVVAAGRRPGRLRGTR